MFTHRKATKYLVIFLSFLFLTSCSHKYTGTHQDTNLFYEDVAQCTKIACKDTNKNVFLDFSIISSALAYGGGGGGGMSNSSTINISYKEFNICMEKKGYLKDDNGLFKLPILTCK